MAHNGVLFLDELPEFKRDVLEVMRQPLEDREVTISRAKFTVTYPSSFMLVASMNPSPSGFFNDPDAPQTSSPHEMQRYLSKISGPLLDRIDLHVEVPNLPTDDLLRAPAGESTATIRARCMQARARALGRQGTTNQALVGQEIDRHASLDSATSAFLRMTVASRISPAFSGVLSFSTCALPSALTSSMRTEVAAGTAVPEAPALAGPGLNSDALTGHSR